MLASRAYKKQRIEYDIPAIRQQTAESTTASAEGNAVDVSEDEFVPVPGGDVAPVTPPRLQPVAIPT